MCPKFAGFLWVLFSCNYIDQIYVLVPWSKLVDRKKNNAFFFPQKDAGLYIPGTPMTSIFEGQPPKTRPKLQSKQGAPFGFQVEIGVETTSRAPLRSGRRTCRRPGSEHCKSEPGGGRNVDSSWWLVW